MENIAVIFGGRSAEHDISIITAISTVIKPLALTKKYRIEPVYIAKNGAWYSDPRLKDIENYTKRDINELLAKLNPIAIEFDGGMKIIKASGIAGRKKVIKIDLVFSAMHGTYGEDGSLMGLLDMANVPYVGCDTAASAVAMNKILAKEVAFSNSIPIVKYIKSTKSEIESNLSKVLTKIDKELSYPVFIKPAHLGSSIGITRASNEAEARNGLEVAAHYDDLVLVEEEVKNLVEVTLPIIGNSELTPAFLESPLTKAEDFFDFDTKYLRGGKKGGKGENKGSQGYSELPAKLDEKLYAKAQEIGLDVYRALNLSGIARVDMLIDSKTNKVYFNEVNPLPGGLYIHNWIKSGISNVELVEKLIAYAKDRFNKKQHLTTTFQTNYLRQF